MAETRNGGGKKSKAKAKATSVAAEAPAPSPSVTTRSAASGKKANKAVETTPQAASLAAAKPKGNGKGKAKAKAPVVLQEVVETESPPSRKKKKRKRVHKRKGSDAGASVETADQHEESPEPPTKKQNVKKAPTEEISAKKKTAFTTPKKAASASAGVAASTPQTEPKNTRSRNKTKGNNSAEKQGEVKDTDKPNTRRVELTAKVETPVSTPQRGRLTRAAAAAAATLEATTTPVKSTASASASDQSPPSSSKSKKKRRRSRQGRRDSAEPSPVVEGVESKPATDSREQNATTADAEEEEEASATALSPVKPKKTIISLVKVKVAASAPETLSPSAVTKGEEERGDEEEKEAVKVASPTQSPPQLSMEAEGQEQIDDEDSAVDQDEVADETEQNPEPQLLEAAPVADQLVDERQDTEDEGELEDGLGCDVEDEEEHKEDSDLDVDEVVEDDELSNDHVEKELPTGFEAEGDEDMQAELAELEDVAGDKEDLSETEDDESVVEAKHDEADDLEEQAVGAEDDADAEADVDGEADVDAEEDVDEEEAFEEEACEKEAYRDDADMQSAAVDFFMAQHPVKAPSVEGTDSDDEQRQEQSSRDSESDGEQRQGQSGSDSESDGGLPAQQAYFSDSEEDEEEDEFQPGMGHYRFFSSPEPSNLPANGSPEVIELSDSDSDDDDESDPEAQHASVPRDTTLPTSHDGQQDEEYSEEHEEEEIDEDEDEDQEEARRNGDDYEVHGPYQPTVYPATSGLTETHESDDNAMEVSSAWNQQAAVYEDGEEVKTEEDTEDEEEQADEDESADKVVEVASDQEEEDEEIDDEGEVPADGELTQSPLDFPQGQQSDSEVLEGSMFLAKPDDHEEAGHDVASPVPSVTQRDHSITATSTSQELFGVRGASSQTPDESVPATTSPAPPAMAGTAVASKQKPSDEPIPATAPPRSSPATPVYTYTTVPSRHLLESVLSASPRATVASLTQGALSAMPLPARTQTQPRTWGPLFGGATVDTITPVVSSSQVEASPLSSWFFAKGPANFKKRVVMPRVKESSVYGSTTPGSPRHRVGSPRPTKKPRLETETKENEETSATRTDDFVQRLLDTSSWRSWYGSDETNQLLDPPLPAAMIKRLGGEAALAMFSSPASDQTAQLTSVNTTEEAEIPKKRRHALSTLEVAIQEEKKKAKAFDQELLLLLQGKTLTGKELADEFAPLLAATTK